MRVKGNKGNITALIVEIVLTVGICLGMTANSFIGLSAESKNLSYEVIADYQTLTTNYIRDFKVLKMEAVLQIEKNLSFDQMQAWLVSREDDFRDAVGDDVFDGFAFTYKGGYVHSWNYGDYSDYDPASRPWYQVAEAANGEVAVVAPYETYLTNTEYIQTYDSLRLSIAQKYSDEISFDYDLEVNEINRLIADRSTIYNGTIAFLVDKNGFVLSSTNAEYYGHNITKNDSLITSSLSEALAEGAKEHNEGLGIHIVDGTLRITYSVTDAEGKTVSLLIPFGEVFQRNILFVLLLALLLIAMELLFFGRNKKHIAALEENRQALNDALIHAEEASHAKGDFMSRMSHEIRTPLNAIIGYLEIARGESGNPEKVDYCLDKSQVASKHLLSIINDVLDVSSIESGRMKIAHEDFDMKQMINELTTIFYAQAKAKGVTFNARVDRIDSEWVSGDELRVKQILLNLLSNAVKFTPENGTVTLGIRQVGLKDSKALIEFKVQDTGIGMSEEYRTRMFKPFEQESATTAKNYGGTGLGLSISNNLVRMMGGQIGVESEQGKGTAFTVVLPFDFSDKQRPEAEQETRRSFENVNALVVDDESDTCEYVSKLMQRFGVRCDTVTSGKKALRRVSARAEEGHPYDLCIIDWCMKEMNGLDTAREIRKLCGKDLPIIIATAYDYTEIVDEAKQAGVNKIISKPLFQSTVFNLLVNTYGKYKVETPKAAQQVDLHGLKLILAEDNEMNMEIAVDLLNKAGLEIKPVVNGKEALDTFLASTAGEYDGILMDIQMPVMDGYEATKRIRASAHPSAKTIPIIAMTANAFNEDVTAAIAAGMNEHISKPINYGKLFAALGKFIKRDEN